MKKSITFIVSCIAISFCMAQDLVVYPTHWWVGMKNTKLQLIIHETTPDIILAVDKLVVRSSSPDLKIVKVNRVENRRYLFLDCVVSPGAKPQTVTISFGGVVPKEWRKFSFELKAKSREDGKTRIQGVTAKDFVYLLMPDRFANGDPVNDYFLDMRDISHDRNNPFDRHGGDLKGVTNHLDYLKELGVTAIWMTPVVENDMSRTSEGGTSRSTYHGYAFTDQYNVDRRLGGNEEYHNMVDATHARGLKVIQDAVYNHIGNDHWSVKDPPMADWLNQWSTYTNTSYKEQPLYDPHASAIDRRIVTDGWFTPFLPDLNQRNPYVSNFLIQYAIWATEEFGLDGWRVDTYFYNDPAFLNAINLALEKEFPSLTIFGETSVSAVTAGAFYSRNNVAFPFKHNLQAITDFPVFYAMTNALKDTDGQHGVTTLYSALCEDGLYKDPTQNSIFLDNHDQDRIYSVIGEDFNKFKMGINWLMTLRGIPQLYYGTEILMKNKRVPTDAEVRRDFPGGWENDPMNKFQRQGRTDSEQVAFDYISKLANFRKNSTAIANGSLMQFVPQNGVYVYFRYNNSQTIMVISNAGKEVVRPDWQHFDERVKGYSKLWNVITAAESTMTGFEIRPGESFVFELKK